MNAHPGEGPLDSWLHSIQELYTNASVKFAVNKAKLSIERQRYTQKYYLIKLTHLTKAERLSLLTLFEQACDIGPQDEDA